MFNSLAKKVARMINGADDIVPREVMPFNLDINRTIKIDTNVHVIYKSKCVLPAFNTVTAIGRFKLGNNQIFRFYVGDNHFLQTISLNGEIQECRFFYCLDTMYPSTPDGWRKLLNVREQSGKIGYYEYVLDDGTEYSRLASWADDDPDWVKPIDFNECIENQKHELIINSHQAMSYGRWLNEDKGVAEYIIVSSETRRNEESVVVEEVVSIFVGIDINPSEVKTII